MSVYTRTHETSDIDEVRISIHFVTYISRTVAELESKLRAAKVEVSRLQAEMESQRLEAVKYPELAETIRTHRFGDPEMRTRDPTRGVDFRRVRAEIIRRSPGLFNVPPGWRESVDDTMTASDLSTTTQSQPSLPPRELADHLLHLFSTETFCFCPTVDVDDFVGQVQAMYITDQDRDESGIPRNTSRSWFCMVLAYFALTAQLIQDDVILEHSNRVVRIGQDFADSASACLGPAWRKNTLDDVRGALALSLYYKMVNEMGAANVWLAVATRIAQNIRIP